jgi:hypothetical protein
VSPASLALLATACVLGLCLAVSALNTPAGWARSPQPDTIVASLSAFLVIVTAAGALLLR